VLGKLKEHNLKLHIGKWWFFHTQMEYLGHIIYLGGLGVSNTKVEAILQVPLPTNVNQL
jgi:hypothetical protein